MVMPMMGMTCLLQVLLKGGERLLCSNQIIGLQRTLQCLDILTDGTTLSCLLGACDPTHRWTRCAILLQRSKSLLCPLEISRLECIGKALKVLLPLFEFALDSRLVVISPRTYARNCHTTPLQE